MGNPIPGESLGNMMFFIFFWEILKQFQDKPLVGVGVKPIFEMEKWRNQLRNGLSWTMKDCNVVAATDGVARLDVRLSTCLGVLEGMAESRY